MANNGHAPANTLRDRIVELRRVPARDLIPNPKNWRRHPEAQSRALRSVLEDVGYADALLVRETPEGLVLIDGHLRAETTPDQTVPVLVLDVSEDEAAKILATLDPLAGMAVTDEEALSLLLETVTIDSAELMAELERLTGQDGPAVGLTDPDDVPAAVQTTTKPGDLWLLGEHRLLCGDSTDAADLAHLMAGADVSMLWSDPPYGLGGYAGRSGKFDPVRGDDVLPEESVRFFAVGEAPESYVCCEFRTYMHLLAARGMPRSLIVWAKPSFGMGNGYRRQHEFVAYFGDYSGTTESDLWIENRDQVYEHPTQKPVALTSRALRNSTRPGDVVLDPFAGSGSSLIAAERDGRRCLALEIDPHYVDVAVRRWEDFTGRKAERG